MKIKLIIYITLLFITSCIKKKIELTSESKLSFNGATEAVNKNGPIEISWKKASGGDVNKYRIYKFKEYGFEKYAEVDGGKTSFIDANVINGLTYNYYVTAVDQDNKEIGSRDQNVMTISYSGIQSVKVNSMSEIEVTLPAVSGNSEIRILVTPLQKSLLSISDETKSVQAGNSLTVTISGLRPGVKYSAQAFARSNLYGIEEKNTVIKKFTMGSNIFSKTNSEFQGWTHVEAYGDTSENKRSSTEIPRWLSQMELDRITETSFEKSINYAPFKPMIRLHWKKFSGDHSNNYQYRIYRNTEPFIDFASDIICSSSMKSTCIVDEVKHYESGINSYYFIEDTNILTPNPALFQKPKYYYLVTKVNYDSSDSTITWVNEYNDNGISLPQHSVFIDVIVPPINMTLIHRTSVNYEMCTNVIKRDVDFTNANRCLYNGKGSIPGDYNPSLFSENLGGYYDFGYNLFVDRWEASCKYDSYGLDIPNNLTPGSVYYNYKSGKCYIKSETTETTVWNEININNIEKAYSNASISINEETYTKAPPLLYITPELANAACASSYDIQFGQKRLPRMREFRAYAAWPIASDVHNQKFIDLMSLTVNPPTVSNDKNKVNGLFKNYIEVSNESSNLSTRVNFESGADSGKIQYKIVKTNMRNKIRSCNTFPFPTFSNQTSDTNYNTLSDQRKLLTVEINNYHTENITQLNQDQKLASQIQSFQTLDYFKNILWDITFLTNENNLKTVSNLASNDDFMSSSKFSGAVSTASMETADCISRYGVQNAIGNVEELSSDQIYSRWVDAANPVILTGVNNPFDLQNTDLLGYKLEDVSGGPTSYVKAPTAVQTTSGMQCYNVRSNIELGNGSQATNAPQSIATPNSTTKKFNPALGLPIESSAILTEPQSSHAQDAIDYDSELMNGDQFSFIPALTTTYNPTSKDCNTEKINNDRNNMYARLGGNFYWNSGISGQAAGRWSTSIGYKENSLGSGFRCVLVAE